MAKISSIYNTQAKMEYRNDPASKTVSFDASKRDRDERLSKVKSQFDSFDSRRAPLKSNLKQSSKYATQDDDDDDDIVAMMDRLDRK